VTGEPPAAEEVVDALGTGAKELGGLLLGLVGQVASLFLTTQLSEVGAYVLLVLVLIVVLGGSGNGKTSIVESYARTFSVDVLFPYSLVVSGQVIRIYDPVKHVRLPIAEEPEGAGAISLR